MATLRELIAVAISEAISVNAAGVDATKRWQESARGSLFPPLIPADGETHYRTTPTAIRVLNEIADRIRENDPEIKKAVSDSTCRSAALFTFGQLLPTYMAGKAEDNYQLFRDCYDKRLKAERVTLTQYFPTWVFRQDQEIIEPFSVGPVRFMTRSDWLDSVERLSGEALLWTVEVRDIWAARSQVQDKTDAFVRALVAITKNQWIAAVPIADYEPSQARKRGLLAVRLAIDTLRLLVRPPESSRMYTAEDHAPPFTIYPMSQADGEDLSMGSTMNIQGASGPPGIAAKSIKANQHVLDAAGRRLEVALAVDSTTFKGHCPALSEQWLSAVHWYGRSCTADVDYVSIVMCAISLETLCGGREGRGIISLICELLDCEPDSVALSDGTKLQSLIEEIYRTRSRITHGTMFTIDLDLRTLRAQAATMATQVLGSYVVELDRFSAGVGGDNLESFMEYLKRKRVNSGPPSKGPNG